MQRIRNDAWRVDGQLENDLKEFVKRNYQRKEILSSVQKKYPQYAWSLRTLALRLKTFGVRYIHYDTNLGDVQAAVRMECEGPGSNLGYRSMTQKIREVHGLQIPRDIVYDIMKDVDPEGLETRGGVGESRKRKRNKRFLSPGPNYTMSLDGHDKLCGFQKSMFPLYIYGGQDTYSGKIMFLKVWTSNNDPKVVARHYFEHVVTSKVLPKILRVDRGTETDAMTALHCYMHRISGDFENDLDHYVQRNVMYGPSTANKIERWWRELHHRMELFFKTQLSMLLENGHYDQTNQDDRNMLAFIYIPVIQRELDVFSSTVWNHKRGRKQVNKQLPTGIPDHIYENCEEYGGVDNGVKLTEECIIQTADESMILDSDDSFLAPELTERYSQIIDFEVQPKDAADVFILLKEHITQDEQ